MLAALHVHLNPDSNFVLMVNIEICITKEKEKQRLAMCIVYPPAGPIKELVCFLDVLRGRPMTDANDTQHLSVSVEGSHQVFLHCDTLLQCRVVCQLLSAEITAACET